MESSREVNDLFGYGGKRVVINGAASGMGEAAAKLLIELGAEVYALDIKEVKLPVKKYIPVDLSNRESIDIALKQVPGKVDRVFICAGVPGPPLSPTHVVMVNFVGNRYMVEALLPRIVNGGAIAIISSHGALGWQSRLKIIDELLAITEFDQARVWLETHPEYLKVPDERRGAYAFSKQCLVAYVKERAWELAKRKIRINAVSPGPTDTPMTPQFHAAYTKELCDRGLSPIGRYATPEEMGNPLVFLSSNMASYISGADLTVDFGTIAASEIRRIRQAYSSQSS